MVIIFDQGLMEEYLHPFKRSCQTRNSYRGFKDAISEENGPSFKFGRGVFFSGLQHW